MAIFLACPPIDPAANELTGFQRSTQESAEWMALQNTTPSEPWTVYELVECSHYAPQAPKLTRLKEPAVISEAQIAPSAE